MQVSHKIDQLISSLNELKPLLSEDKNENSKQFSDLLHGSLEGSSSIDENLKSVATLPDQKKTAEIPDWVDTDYGFDPENPRKPNMRELMESFSNKSVEDLYKEPVAVWKGVSHNASEILYGVIDANNDTRNWSEIMSADDSLSAARMETRKIYDPKVDIESIFIDGELINQQAVLKDQNENILRIIPSDITLAEATIRNFGATESSVPKNIEAKIVDGKFDNNLLSFLKSFDKKPSTVEKVVIQSAGEALAAKLSQQIPLDELAKI